jgi:hypothetical protein
MAWRKSSWAKAVSSSSAFLFGSAPKKQPYRTRLLLELLEDRCVPTTITPTMFEDGVLDSGSLRDAVLQFNADPGSGDDTIQLLAVTYALTIVNTAGHHETAGLEGDLNITNTSHQLIVQGAGSSTIIDASQLQDRVFQIVNPGTVVVFQDLVISGGLAQDDGSNGALAGSTDALGGGILNNGGNITLDNVVLTNNVARGGDGPAGAPALPGGAGHWARGGALYSTGGSLDISGTTIASNQARGGNGGLGGAGYFSGGAGGAGGVGQGAGLYAAGGALTLSDSTLATNEARGGNAGNGGDYNSNGGAGGAGQGGGLYATGGSIALSSTTVATNEGIGGNGGRGAGSTAHGNGGGGAAGQGGGLYVNGAMLTLANSILSTNTARGGNGGSGADVSFPTGAAGAGGPGQGGGLYVGGGMVTLTNSTLSTNTVRGGDGGNGGNGGGFRGGNGGNGAAGLGGGIYVSGGTFTVTNGTVAFNSAEASVGGAGGTGTPPGNPGTGGTGQGGGVRSAGATVNALNTLFSNNAAANAPDFSGPVASLGYNLFGDSSGGSGYTATDLLDVDPLLGPLQDNGGPSKTHALLAGSPALKAGDPAQLGVADQRGVVRTGGVNIGAYQASASAFVLTVPGTVAAGTAFDVIVQAVDAVGQVAVGYTGTVHFTTDDPDPGVVLPTDYTFTAEDAGTHTFMGGVTLYTDGSQITVTDTVMGTLSGSIIITLG